MSAGVRPVDPEPAETDSGGMDSGGRDAAGSVTLTGAVAIGIGGMVGGGIFAVLGVAAEQAGGATPVAFLIAGAVAALTGYSYSKLSVAGPDAGGTVAFIDRAFGINELTGTINVVLWAGYIATTALYAAAFGHYAATLLPGNAETSAAAFKSLAVVGVLVPWIINLANAGLVARTEGFVVALKMTILLVVVAAGVPTADAGALAPSTWSSPVTLVAAGMLIFVAYEGFELISNASADVVAPTDTLPRAYALAIGIVIVLYAAIAAVVVGSLSAEEIAAAQDFALAEATSASLGQVGFVMVAVSAVLATFSAINATLYGAARLSFTLATAGELPAEFHRQPWHQPIGLHITATVGLAIAVALPLASISAIASWIFLVVFAVVNAAALRSARRARVSPPIAAAGALACAASLVVLTVSSARQDPVALVVLAILLTAALVAERRVLRHRRPEPGSGPGPASAHPRSGS
jgi:amino acid transporter